MSDKRSKGGKRVTHCEVEDSCGNPVKADPFGNNIAFACIDCGYPVLAVVRDGWLGSSAKKLTKCRDCGAGYFVKDIDSDSKKVIIELVPMSLNKENANDVKAKSSASLGAADNMVKMKSKLNSEEIMEMREDGSGQPYVEVECHGEHIRLTYKESSAWGLHEPAVRIVIRASNGRLRRGPEIPVNLMGMFATGMVKLLQKNGESIVFQAIKKEIKKAVE